VASFAAQAGIALELAARRADAERLSLFEDRDRIARDGCQHRRHSATVSCSRGGAGDDGPVGSMR
jgi:hypothetical protein